MKILFIIGTRPEAIKMIPLIFECLNREYDVDVCVTGQHKLVKKFLNEYKIFPKYNLNIMKKKQSINHVLHKTLSMLDKKIRSINYDYVFVHGDTTSACAGALWAFNNRLKIAHIEAGLRSKNRYEPYPEEINRVIIDRIADIYFAPTIENKNNLINEGVDSKNIFVVGNTIIDMLKITMKEGCAIKNQILITCHRRENREKLDEICNSINKIASKYNNFKFIFISHPNKNLRKIIEKKLNTKNISIVEPLKYKDFIYELSSSFAIITDSGGVLEESFFLNKKVLIIRNNIERYELISENIMHSKINANDIINNFDILVNSKNNIPNKNILGNGDASKKIIDMLK